MIPTLHVPFDLRLAPTSVNGVNSSVEDLYSLRVQYLSTGAWQVFHSVHVPKPLQEALSSGTVESFHLETIIPNSPTERALPGSPSYLVMGVRLKGGPELECVPAKLRATKAAYLALGVAASACAVALLSATYTWTGALILVAGTHAIRTARGIPAHPFIVGRQCIG